MKAPAASLSQPPLDVERCSSMSKISCWNTCNFPRPSMISPIRPHDLDLQHTRRMFSPSSHRAISVTRTAASSRSDGPMGSRGGTRRGTLCSRVGSIKLVDHAMVRKNKRFESTARVVKDIFVSHAEEDTKQPADGNDPWVWSSSKNQRHQQLIDHLCILTTDLQF